MRKAILSVTAVLLSGAILVSCGGGAKDEKGGVGDLKTKLEKNIKTFFTKYVQLLEEILLQLSSTLTTDHKWQLCVKV